MRNVIPGVLLCLTFIFCSACGQPVRHVPLPAQSAESAGFILISNGRLPNGAGSAPASSYWLLSGDEAFAELRASLVTTLDREEWNIAPVEPREASTLLLIESPEHSCFSVLDLKTDHPASIDARGYLDQDVQLKDRIDGAPTVVLIETTACS